MVRLTSAPRLGWCCTFQRKMSPTAMWTRSRSPASNPAWVPLPLPWTPIMTYLRTRQATAPSSPTGVGCCAAGSSLNANCRSHHRRSLGSSDSLISDQSAASRSALMNRAMSFRLPCDSSMPYMLRRVLSSLTSHSRSPGHDRYSGTMTTPLAGPLISSIRSGRRPAGPNRPASKSEIGIARILLTSSLPSVVSGGSIAPGVAILALRSSYAKPALVSSHVAGTSRATLESAGHSPLAQLAYLRGRGVRGDVVAWRLAVPPRDGRQLAQLGIHLRVADLCDLRRGLLGQDGQGRA